MSPDPKESEIKVTLVEAEVARVRERLGEPLRTVRQLSYFFETPQDHLAKAELSLRVREQSNLAGGDEQILLTVKGMGRRAGALMVRPEIECQLDPSDWAGIQDRRVHFGDIELPPIMKLRKALGDLKGLDLELMGRIENIREVYNMRAEELELELLLDHTLYPDGSGDFEIESELSQSMAGRAARALRALFEELDIDWRPSPVGKYIRFRRKIDRDPDAARADA